VDFGLQIQDSIRKVSHQLQTEPNCWHVNSGDGIQIENSDVIKTYNRQMTNPKAWRTFEDFTNCAFGYWKITIDHYNCQFY